MQSKLDPILIYHLDDNIVDLDALKLAFSKIKAFKITVFSFQTSKAFYDKLSKRPQPNIAILDVQLANNENGIEIAKIIRKKFPYLTILMYSNFLDTNELKAARLAGADDFISKKHSSESQAKHFLQIFTEGLVSKVTQSQKRLKSSNIDKNIIGQQTKKIARRLPLLLESDFIDSILLTGESGTGKTFVTDLFISLLPKFTSRILIRQSLSNDFSPLNAIKALENGWIILDDIENLSITQQQTVANYLRTGSVKNKIKIFATSQFGISQLVKSPSHSHDLLKILMSSRIHLMPIRERKEEIRDFIEYFISKLEHGPYIVHNSVIDHLVAYDYRSANITELADVINQLKLFVTGNTITPASLPDKFITINHPPIMENHRFCKQPSDCISIEFSNKSYGEYCQILLAEVVKRILDEEKIKDRKPSLRSLSARLKFSRTTLRKRLEILAEDGFISQSDYNSILH